MGKNPEQSDPNSIEYLQSELEYERIGRAVAEAHIKELENDLRRANRAITALMVDVDADPDLPQD